MKIFYPLSIAIVASSVAFCQSGNKPVNCISSYMKCTSFSISKPLREWPTAQQHGVAGEQKLPLQVGTKSSQPLHLDQIAPPDPVVQSNPGSIDLDTTLTSFEGGTFYRPDATGAAGPNNYVQAVNLCNIRIYDKSGNLQLATDLTSLGGGCSDDPIVLYDKLADRWLISDVTDNYLDLTVAISKTPDPTGQYYIYKYAFPVMPDFPKYSVWSDGYYVTFRNINNDTVGIGVLNRTRMLKGDPSAGMIMAKFPNGSVINKNNLLPGSPKILSCDGVLPAFGKPNYLMYFTNVNSGDPINSIVVYKLATDTTLKKCTVTLDTILATQPFNAYFIGYGSQAIIAEPGGQKVWSLDGPFQYRVPYIRFTGYNSAVLCNTVNLGNYVAGIRWYELRQNDTTQKWSIYQQATFGPSDNISRWNSSIAMNLNGDISLAYNVTNSTTLYPGIRYTGRLAGDPLGQITFAEKTVVTGSYSYNQQWGDYSESTLDPDGVTFWHTNQYIKTTGDPNTRIFSFRLTSPTAVPAISKDQIAFSVFQSDGYLNVHVMGLPSNDHVVVNLFDMEGKQISARWLSPVSGQFENKISVAGLAQGPYFVRIGNSGFQKVMKIIVN